MIISGLLFHLLALYKKNPSMFA